MTIAVDKVKCDLYSSIYNAETDISELIENLKKDSSDYSCNIIIDSDNNIISGIDILRAYKQLRDDGVKGFSKIEVTKQSFISKEQEILSMIENHDHSNSTNEELCRATYAYYENYRKCYDKSHELYLTGKQLYKILPDLFEIKRSGNSNTLLAGSCYEDYIRVGRKIHELEEQEDYENLECLLIQLENHSPMTIRHDKILSQIEEWTDEIRSEIRKTGREKGISKTVVSRISKKKAEKKADVAVSEVSTNESTVNEPIDVIADLWDTERDRSMNSYDLLLSAYDTISSCFHGVKTMIEYEPETEVTPEAKEQGHAVLALMEKMKEYIIERFSL